MKSMGMVAVNAHQNGRVKSAISPRSKKTSQKIFRSISRLYLTFVVGEIRR